MSVDTVFHITLTVTGMTCQHCANAVTEELSALHGVLSVDVTLSTGSVTVHSDRELNDGEVAAAIDEAGYQIAG